MSVPPDLMSALMGSAIEGPEQTAAVARQLRGNSAVHTLAQLSGDPILQKFGQAGQARTTKRTEGLRKAKQSQEQQRIMEEHYSGTRTHNTAQLAQQAATQAALDAHRTEQYKIDREKLASDAALKRATMEATIGRDLQTRVQTFQQRMTAEGVEGMNVAIQEGKDALSPYLNKEGKVTKDIPGYGPVAGSLPDALIFGEGQEIRNTMQAVYDDLIQQRSGAAVSDQEYRRLLKEFGTSMGGTDQEMVNAFQRLEGRANAVEQGIRAGFGADVINMYDQRRGRGRAPTQGATEAAGAPGEITTPGGRAYKEIS